MKTLIQQLQEKTKNVTVKRWLHLWLYLAYCSCSFDDRATEELERLQGEL